MPAITLEFQYDILIINVSSKAENSKFSSVLFPGWLPPTGITPKRDLQEQRNFVLSFLGVGNSIKNQLILHVHTLHAWRTRITTRHRIPGQAFL